MFPSQTPLAVPRDQFLRSTSSVGRRRLRWGQLLLLVPGLLTGVAVWFAQPPLPQLSAGVLPATAILTGFTFAMANTFWTKSVEARRDPRWAVDAQALDSIDDTRNHMIWTVAIGVLTVAILVIFALFGTTVIPGRIGAVLQVLTRLGEALAGALVLYLVTLVSAGLHLFNRAVAILKA